MDDGLLIVDKPAGMTSHDVVSRCRRIVGQRRVGHAGTLDPGATGVLLVALGRATRLIRFLSDLPKFYVGEVVLGTATSTLDNEGEVTGSWDMRGVSIDEVRVAASKFTGDIMQVPPMVSALKVDGRRLHELARDGVEVERKSRPVTVHSLEVEPTPSDGVFRIAVSCSSGTYVRSLAADIGEALGGGAHLRNLRRTAIGNFDVQRAVNLEELEEGWQTCAIPPAEALQHLSRLVADSTAADDIAHGRRLDKAALGTHGEGPWAVVDDSGSLLAVYEHLDDQHLKAGVVMTNR